MTGRKNAASLILRDMGFGIVHHNIPANNALKKKNKKSAILLISEIANTPDRICVVPNHETQKKANITAHKISKIRSIIITMPFRFFNYRPYL